MRFVVKICTAKNGLQAVVIVEVIKGDERIRSRIGSVKGRRAVGYGTIFALCKKLTSKYFGRDARLSGNKPTKHFECIRSNKHKKKKEKNHC